MKSQSDGVAIKANQQENKISKVSYSVKNFFFDLT